MYHDHNAEFLNPEDLANLGSDAVAYVRKITAEEIADAFPEAPKLKSGQDYWAMFAANGEPLMLADQESEILSTAFYSDLEAIQPN
ncbi:MAG: DUF1150 family protein [Pseudomonadota bacterium]